MFNNRASKARTLSRAKHRDKRSFVHWRIEIWYSLGFRNSIFLLQITMSNSFNSCLVMIQYRSKHFTTNLDKFLMMILVYYSPIRIKKSNFESAMHCGSTKSISPHHKPKPQAETSTCVLLVPLQSTSNTTCPILTIVIFHKLSLHKYALALTENLWEY